MLTIKLIAVLLLQCLVLRAAFNFARKEAKNDWYKDVIQGLATGTRSSLALRAFAILAGSLLYSLPAWYAFDFAAFFWLWLCLFMLCSSVFIDAYLYYSCKEYQAILPRNTFVAFLAVTWFLIGLYIAAVWYVATPLYNLQ